MITLKAARIYKFSNFCSSTNCAGNHGHNANDSTVDSGYYTTADIHTAGCNSDTTTVIATTYANCADGAAGYSSANSGVASGTDTIVYRVTACHDLYNDNTSAVNSVDYGNIATNYYIYSNGCYGFICYFSTCDKCDFQYSWCNITANYIGAWNGYQRSCNGIYSCI